VCQEPLAVDAPASMELITQSHSESQEALRLTSAKLVASRARLKKVTRQNRDHLNLLKGFFPADVVGGVRVVKRRRPNTADTNVARRRQKEKKAVDLFQYILTTTAILLADKLAIDLERVSIAFDGVELSLVDVDNEDDEDCPALNSKMTSDPVIQARLRELLSVRDKMNISERQLHEVLMVLPEVRGVLSYHSCVCFLPPVCVGVSSYLFVPTTIHCLLPQLSVSTTTSSA
jgi:hypothetical protein